MGSPEAREDALAMNLNTCHMWAEDGEQVRPSATGRRSRRRCGSEAVREAGPRPRALAEQRRMSWPTSNPHRHRSGHRRCDGDLLRARVPRARGRRPDHRVRQRPHPRVHAQRVATARDRRPRRHRRGRGTHRRWPCRFAARPTSSTAPTGRATSTMTRPPAQRATPMRRSSSSTPSWRHPARSHWCRSAHSPRSRSRCRPNHGSRPTGRDRADGPQRVLNGNASPAAEAIQKSK